MKDLHNGAMTVCLARAEQTPRFDEQMGQHHYAGAGRPVGDYLRQMVELKQKHLFQYAQGVDARTAPPFCPHPVRPRTPGHPTAPGLPR